MVSFKREATSGSLSFNFSEQGNNQGITGIKGASNINLSPDGKHIYVAGELDDALAVFERNLATGELSFVERIEDGNGIDGLNGVKAVILSTDGDFVYAAGFWDNSIAAFSRNNENGKLTYIDRYKDGLFGVDGLSGTNDLMLSPDQNHLYATGFWDNAIAVFERNPSNGELEFIASYKDGANGIDGLQSITGITISADGNFVYAAGNEDNAIAIFNRNIANGNLTYVGLVKDGLNGVEGLGGIKKIRISADGLHLYGVSDVDNALVHFERNVTTGLLMFTGLYQNGGSIEGLEGATDLQISGNGEHLYVTAETENSITAFQRDVNTGILTFQQIQVDGEGEANGIAGANSVIVSQDGRYIYASGPADDAIAVFSCTYIFERKEVICEGASIEIAGVSFTNPGIYNEVIENGSCTHIINLELSVQPTEVSVDAEICSGDSYLLGGNTLTTSGIYIETLTSTLGCDSIVILNLNVVSELEGTILNEVICEGGAYYLNGSAYTASGTYEEYLISSFGCDSIVQLNLTVSLPMETNIQETICEGEFYVIGTSNYHVNGFFSQTLESATGCDSIVNLSLVVIPTQAILNEVICEGDGYELGGVIYTEAGTYVESVTTTMGCELIATLNLEVKPELIAEGIIIEDEGNGLGAVILNVEGGNGSYTYEWSNGSTESSIHNLLPNVYNVVVTDALGCRKELTFQVNITTGVEELKNGFSASIWPNPVPRKENFNVTFELENSQQIKLELFSTIGEHVLTQELELTSGTQQLTVKSPVNAGLYFIRLSNSEGQQQTLRLLVP